MSTTTDYSYIGSGPVYLREINANKGLLAVGNASALNFAVSEEIKELKDFTSPGGGTRNEVRRIENVEVSMTLHDLSPDNWARAIYGTATEVVGAVIATELHTAYKGALVAFNFLPAATPAPVVTNDATPLVVGVDYEIRSGGILILPTATAVADGDEISVAYTSQAVDVVQAITATGKEYEMLFDGLNEARSGKRTRVRVWRVKVGAAADLSLIGDEYAALEVTGKILKDASITGNGLSQYFKVDIEK